MTSSDGSGDLRRLAWGSAVIGFALGGFLDGIMLPHVLQCHHLNWGRTAI